jgi:mitogen-activated protein kinase kinase kinase
MFHIGIATQHPPLPDKGEMSELGIDFIAHCLTLNADLRPTATELLTHEWITPMSQQITDYSQFGSGTQSLATNGSSWYDGQQNPYDEQYASEVGASEVDQQHHYQGDYYSTAPGEEMPDPAYDHMAEESSAQTNYDGTGATGLFDDGPSVSG